jgi:hypothetical protein
MRPIHVSRSHHKGAVVTLEDASGTIVGTPVTVTIGPYKQVARFVSELFPGVIGAAFVGSVNLQSATSFVPLGLAFTGSAFSTIALDATPATSPIPIRSLIAGSIPDTPKAGTIGGAGAVIFPQFADGGGWATEIGLINRGSTTATGRIDLFNSDGSPLTVELNGSVKSTLTYSIPAGGTFTFAPRDSNGQSPL